MIKITSKVNIGFPYIEGRLVLIKDENAKGILIGNDKGDFYINPFSDLSSKMKTFNPIIISITEEIKDGDWAMGKGKKDKGINGLIYRCGETVSADWCNKHCYKVLAISEDFTRDQLLYIVKKNMQDGGKILVEVDTYLLTDEPEIYVREPLTIHKQHLPISIKFNNPMESAVLIHVDRDGIEIMREVGIGENKKFIYPEEKNRDDSAKELIIDKIKKEISALDKQDADGHIWWNKFEEFIQEIEKL